MLRIQALSLDELFNCLIRRLVSHFFVLPTWCHTVYLELNRQPQNLIYLLTVYWDSVGISFDSIIVEGSCIKICQTFYNMLIVCSKWNKLYFLYLTFPGSFTSDQTLYSDHFSSPTYSSLLWLVSQMDRIKYTSSQETLRLTGKQN